MPPNARIPDAIIGDFVMKRVLPLKKLYVVILSILFLLTLISFVEASCGSANCSLITSSQAGVTNKGRFVFDISHRYILQEDKQRGSGDTSEVLVPKVNFEDRKLELGKHRELRTINQLTQLDVSFGITDKLTASMNVPFRNDRLHEHDDDVSLANPAGEFTNDDGTTGFGDITLLLKYAILQTLKHQLVLGAGIKFASGEFKLRDSEGGDQRTYIDARHRILRRYYIRALYFHANTQPAEPFYIGGASIHHRKSVGLPFWRYHIDRWRHDIRIVNHR